jgi:hypothetical protein
MEIGIEGQVLWPYEEFRAIEFVYENGQLTAYLVPTYTTEGGKAWRLTGDDACDLQDAVIALADLLSDRRGAKLVYHPNGPVKPRTTVIDLD